MVERGEEGCVQDVLARDPGYFLWSVALPVHEILKATLTASGVQDLIYGVHRALIQQERQNGFAYCTPGPDEEE